MTQEGPGEAESGDAVEAPTGTAPTHEAAAGTAPTGAEITTTDCRQCGAKVSGLNNRYACSYCGWVNHWAEGSTVLPSAEADLDHPGH